MRSYEYLLYGDKNSYGQSELNEQVAGTTKLAISRVTQAIQDNIKYSNIDYIGLTHDKAINDNYVIKYGNELLKVQSVNPDGRFIQVFMSESV